MTIETTISAEASGLKHLRGNTLPTSPALLARAVFRCRAVASSGHASALPGTTPPRSLPSPHASPRLHAFSPQSPLPPRPEKLSVNRKAILQSLSHQPVKGDSVDDMLFAELLQSDLPCLVPGASTLSFYIFISIFV